MRSLFGLALALLISGCAAMDVAKENVAETPVFSKTSSKNLPGLTGPLVGEGFASAYSKTCARLSKKDEAALIDTQNPEFGRVGDWLAPCQAVQEGADPDEIIADYFDVYAVRNSNSGKDEGLFTGYYEASLKGSKTRTDKYNIPLHARPDDLVMVDLGAFRDTLKGQRIAGRVKDGRLRPYESRPEILQSNNYTNPETVLVWVDSAVDAFFVQIQGSGLVELEDGTVMRIGYAGQNGHIYTAIGKVLIERGALAKEEVSLQTIRAWLEANPDSAEDVMSQNASYVYFRELDTEGPVGGEGVPLTAESSLAIDHGLYPYGMPIWVDIEHPTEQGRRIQKLMVGQDTGGAIKGPVRGDFFWGHGPRAEDLAGKMKSKGRMFIFIPKSVKP